ncbi:MarR family winged helix-turn-helix transcriptional regulator [Jiangella alkaliphila]|uniref:DNA-binding transcriptional regulator, MarR family n=1 Tax=Jiangella alkaliphila TaxID=419479 RepID=A0A1H2J827_9ACTN|nr:MarR family transcriptional regulator [Jiangella alkaliphila]SDU52462.1 DNA-binding transcriptional regulator, MarR family [Jiangella alkaliphila]
MTSLQKHTEALGRILELVIVVSDDMTRTLAAQGLSDARAHLLWELHERGPSTQRVLADALRVSARNITGLVDALVATGFVTREPHPTDRRATLVTFTEHGAAMTAAMERDQHEFARILFADMPDERLAALVDGLDDVLARLRAHGVSVEAARKATDPESEAGP